MKYSLSPRRQEISDRLVIGSLIFIVTPLVLLFFRSTYWAAMVPVVTAFVGLLSKEDWTNKMVTMAATAQGTGLLMTLLGLGQVIGPAIAAHNVDAIGYGIAVKIEASVMGIGLSVIFNGLIARAGGDVETRPH